MDREAAILLPGAVLPAGPAYDGLIAALGDRWEVHAKDLEVYAADAPPPDFSLETEVAGVLRHADEAGFERFHLVGYSAGEPWPSCSRPDIPPACGPWRSWSRPGRATRG